MTHELLFNRSFCSPILPNESFPENLGHVVQPSPAYVTARTQVPSFRGFAGSRDISVVPLLKGAQ